jgi:hypothetical protein
VGSTCVGDSSLRTSVKSGPCTVSGRTWTREDLERTGHTDVGRALETLDPSITTHH